MKHFKEKTSTSNSKFQVTPIQNLLIHSCFWKINDLFQETWSKLIEELQKDSELYNLVNIDEDFFYCNVRDSDEYFLICPCSH
jgi:hypothetical protein